jgi:hypothetical protein
MQPTSISELQDRLETAEVPPMLIDFVARYDSIEDLYARAYDSDVGVISDYLINAGHLRPEYSDVFQLDFDDSGCHTDMGYHEIGEICRKIAPSGWQWLRLFSWGVGSGFHGTFFDAAISRYDRERYTGRNADYIMASEYELGEAFMSGYFFGCIDMTSVDRAEMYKALGRFVRSQFRSGDGFVSIFKEVE